MKHYLSTFAGSAICGGFAFGIWPELWKTYGLMGGWLAATLIIGIMWYMNHYNGAILNGRKNMAGSGMVYRLCRHSLGNRPFPGRFHSVFPGCPHFALLSDRRCFSRNNHLDDALMR